MTNYSSPNGKWCKEGRDTSGRQASLKKARESERRIFERVRIEMTTFWGQNPSFFPNLPEVFREYNPQVNFGHFFILNRAE